MYKAASISSAAVIPEINNTLQFLQGKSMYSSLDLRQAYMAMRIDEESQPLTTFLTPSGSYRFRSLPSGWRLLRAEYFFLVSLSLYSYSLNFQEFKVWVTSK